MQETLDPQIQNLAKAIMKAETGSSTDPYNQKGDSGEIGAYQFMPETWKGWSKEILGDENAPMTVENQNKVAYSKIKQWKEKGLTPAQIASKWNSGSEHLYKQGHKGVTTVNGSAVAYDTPGYAEKVSQYYRELSAQNSVIPQVDPAKAPQQDPNLAQDITEDLGNRFRQGGQAVSDTLSGKINPLSGILQVAGAGAGAIGDVTGNVLMHTPLVGGALKAVGKGLGKVAGTESGQAVQEAYSKLPESWRKNIGAATNIATLVPIAKGASLAKQGVKSGIKKATGKTAVDDIVEAISPEFKGGTKAGAKTAKNLGTTKSPITGEISLNADPRVIQSAEVIAEVSPKFARLKTFSEKANAIDDGISKLANDLRTNLKGDVQPILTTDDLLQVENQMKEAILQNPVLVGDAAETAHRIFNQYKRFLPEGRDIDMTDLLDARQKLDKWVKKIKGEGVFEPRMENAMSTGLRSVRQGVNNLIDAKVPNAKVKELLKKQSLLFDALEDIAPRVAKEVGTTRLSRLGNRHPLIKSALTSTGKYTAGGLAAGLGLSAFGPKD